jgi:peptidoglycan/LPS O-acetylase OafA/YrhL
LRLETGTNPKNWCESRRPKINTARYHLISRKGSKLSVEGWALCSSRPSVFCRPKLLKCANIFIWRYPLINSQVARKLGEKATRQLNLDLLRLIAAQLVVIGHSYSLLVTSQGPALGSKSPENSVLSFWLWRLTEVFVGRGTDAVLVFFVLSGLLVGYTVIVKVRANRFFFKDYILRRTSRMYSVLLPALVLSGIAIHLCFAIGNGPLVISANSPWYPVDWPVQESMSLATMACNALFLQTVFCSQSMHNSSLWSLANEFHYYLIFPALALIGFIGLRNLPSKVMLFCLAVIGTIAWFWAIPMTQSRPITTYFFVLGFLVWILGAIVPFVIPRLRSKFERKGTRLAMGLTITFWMICLYFFSQGIVRSVTSIGLCLCFFFLGDLVDRVASKSSVAERTIKFMSDYSFSLYVVHVPVLFTLLSFSDSLRNKLSGDLVGLLTFHLILIGINLIAIAFYFCFERHHQRLYEAFRRKLVPIAK